MNLFQFMAFLFNFFEITILTTNVIMFTYIGIIYYPDFLSIPTIDLSNDLVRLLVVSTCPIQFS